MIIRLANKSTVKQFPHSPTPPKEFRLHNIFIYLDLDYTKLSVPLPLCAWLCVCVCVWGFRVKAIWEFIINISMSKLSIYAAQKEETKRRQWDVRNYRFGNFVMPSVSRIGQVERLMHILHYLGPRQQECLHMYVCVWGIDTAW